MRASTQPNQLCCTYRFLSLPVFLGNTIQIMTNLNDVSVLRVSLYFTHCHIPPVSVLLVHAGKDHMTALQGACVGVAGSLSGSVRLQRWRQGSASLMGSN